MADAERICSVEGCSRSADHGGGGRRGWCGMHYQRWRTRGSLEDGEGHHHGFSYSAEYRAWQGLRNRCLVPDHADYSRYGGRGITVCDRWRSSFPNFLSDMGERPSPAHSIDRIDNDGPYSPENCRWATASEQQRNRRTNHRLAHRGRTLTVTEWAETLGLPAHTIWERLKRGWPVADALDPQRYKRVLP